jgi:hypothetical protein
MKVIERSEIATQAEGPFAKTGAVGGCLLLRNFAGHYEPVLDRRGNLMVGGYNREITTAHESCLVKTAFVSSMNDGDI